MRILLLGPTSQYGKGGIETQLEELIPALERLGHHCDAFDTFHQPWSLPLMFQLVRALTRCDVVCTMGLNLKAHIFCFALRRPVLLYYHVMLGGSGFRRYIHCLVSKNIKRIYNSSFIARMVHAGPELPHVVYPCYSARSYFQPPEQHFNWHDRPVELGFVGRLIPEKGAHILLQACSSIENHAFKIKLIGEGPAKNDLKALASQCSSSVEFAGALDANGVANALHHIKVLVIPSLWQEPFGLVMLEALAAGCHVVASEIGGLPEAGGQFATYVPAGNIAALKQAIVRLLSGPPPIDCAARDQHLQRFTPGVLAMELEAQLQQLVKH